MVVAILLTQIENLFIRYIFLLLVFLKKHPHEKIFYTSFINCNYCIFFICKSTNIPMDKIGWRRRN